MSKTTTLKQVLSPRRRDDYQMGRLSHTRELLPKTWQRIALCWALFLVVLGIRWWQIGRYGSDLPFWDQWDAEATGLYKRYFDGTLVLGDWFAPHNEHRLFFTRLLDFSLLMANGQWDARLQMIVNAGLYALVSCGLFLLLTQGRKLRFSAIAGFGLAVMFSLPYGWENTLNGFQSQFYFLVTFSVVVLFLLLNSRGGSWTWFIGLLAGVAGLFSMSSGLLAPAAVIGVLLLLLLRDVSRWRELLRQSWTTIVACLLLILAGVLLSVKVEQNEQYQAYSVGQFMSALTNCLSWPWASLWWCFFSWLPFLIFLADYLRRKIEDHRMERFVLGLGLWVLLQASAIAFARSVVVFASRYRDVLSYGLLVNVLCAALLFESRFRKSRMMLGLMLVWLMINGIGLYQVSFKGGMTERKQQYEVERIRTVGFLETDNFSFLSPVANPLDIPYYDARRLAQLLRDPDINPILPASIRSSLSLIPTQGSPQPSFIDESRPEEGLMRPDQWNRTGIFTRFAVIEPEQRFEYHVTKTRGLPFLLLYFSGDRENLSIRDAGHVSHLILPLPSGQAQLWHRAVVYCPTEECVITGSARSSRIAFMEPKEIGTLSIAAIIAGKCGTYLAVFGVVCFIVAVLADITKYDRTGNTV